MTSMATSPGVDVPPFATLVTDEAAEALAWHPFEALEGVEYKLLWRSGQSVAGILRIAPGSSMSPHAHVRSHHHMWVIAGLAGVRARRAPAPRPGGRHRVGRHDGRARG
jgi:hypothetical protein